jgi:hypothetical protein
MSETTTQSAEPEVETEEVELKLYPATALQNRPPGIYMDDLEREGAEVWRAKLEGREPDLENPPPTAGTPLRPLAHLVDSAVVGNPVLMEALEKSLEDKAVTVTHIQAVDPNAPKSDESAEAPASEETPA